MEISMKYKLRLTAALPKEPDLDGWADPVLAEKFCEDERNRREILPQVAVIIYGVRNVEVGKSGTDTGILEILRVQPVQTTDGRVLVKSLLEDEYDAQHGTIPSYELLALSKRAFVGLPRPVSEIDREEESERDTMSPTDELRRHLERVHGRPEALDMTALEAEHQHAADHAGDLPTELAHDPEWMGWTRVDIEAAIAETGGDEEESADFAERIAATAAMNTEDRIVAALEDGADRDDGTPTNDELEGPDPDLGKDLDDDGLPDVPSALDSTHSLFSEGRGF
jgi:hypothetical protein